MKEHPARYPVCLIGLPCIAGVAFAAAGDEPGVSAHRLWLFAHLLLFCFWLGADLGVVLCARAAAKAGLSAEQRQRTLELMNSIGLAPRIAASLMLTVGGILTEYVGIEHPWWQMAGIVLLGPVWLTVVFLGYVRDGTPLGSTMVSMDEGIRALLVVAVPASVAWSWFTGRLASAPYVAPKLLIFAALMAAGLILSRRWRTVGRPEVTDSEPGAVRAQTLPLVIAIWAGLALAALLGITRPGAHDTSPEVSLAVQAISAESRPLPR